MGKEKTLIITKSGFGGLHDLKLNKVNRSIEKIAEDVASFFSEYTIKCRIRLKKYNGNRFGFVVKAIADWNFCVILLDYKERFITTEELADAVHEGRVRERGNVN